MASTEVEVLNQFNPGKLPGFFTSIVRLRGPVGAGLNNRSWKPIINAMAKKDPQFNSPRFNQALSPAYWNVTCKKLASTLSKKYRINLGKATAELAVETFAEWSERETAGGLVQINLFRAEGIRSPVFFLMKAASGSVVCNLLLGGTTRQVPMAAGEHAPISRQLEARFIKVLAAQIETELASFGLGVLKFYSAETDIRMYNQIPPGISCQTLKLQFTVDQEVIEVLILLPLDAASRLQPVSDSNLVPAVTLLSYKHLQDIEVDVSLSLAELQMTLKQLVQLVPGDVLQADSTDQGSWLRVEGKPYKSGRLEIDDHKQWNFIIDESSSKD